MLTFIKMTLRAIIPPASYALGLLIMVYTLFKDVRVGLLLLVALIPQPNLWYKYQQYPLGSNFLDFLFLACAIGIVLQKRGAARLPHSLLVVIFIAANYAALVNASLQFGLPFPVSGANWLLPVWKNYAQMILLYFLAAKSIETEKEAKILALVMAAVVFVVAYRAYKSFYGGSSFDYNKRAGGPFENVGLGANHLGAFMAYAVAMFGGLFLCDTDRKRKLAYAAAMVFGVLALMFAFSRGAYLAALVVLVFFGVRKKPILIAVCLVLLITWKAVLPASVVDRITMTRGSGGEIEASAGHRVNLWEHAWKLFQANPVFGVGYGCFGFTVPEGELKDTHNVYVKMLSEQGVVGLGLLLVVLVSMYRSGSGLMRKARSPFLRGLGLGMMGCVIACMVANLFGDRWSYFVLGGYLWVWWGLVDKMAVIESRRESGELMPGPGGHGC